MALSPMMQQYLDIKEQYKDCILFFRLGDFYEMFFEDAKTASRELELTLTGRNCGLEERAPMCGVPFHSCEPYIAKLVDRGYKVAICEQLEDPASAKGIVKRDIIRIVTPGTVVSQSMLDEKENNYLASVYYTDDAVGFAYCDISTGEISASEFRDSTAIETLVNELVKINAREVLINEHGYASVDTEKLRDMTGAYFEQLDDGHYIRQAAESAVLRQFRTGSLLGLGLADDSTSVFALGALLQYLSETQKQDMSHMTRLNVYETGAHMSLDKATIRNLEITETLYDKKLKGSLLGVLDKTGTAMGSRKMKQWLREPLNDAETIKKRLDAVEYLSDQILLRNDLRASLRQIYDFERLAGRVACGSANGKDLIALRNSCMLLPEIKTCLEGSGEALLEEIYEGISELKEVSGKIELAICEEPPFQIREGGVIKEGYSQELDDLKFSIRDAKQWIAGLEEKERERTGIKNLKVGFNKVFGYYIDVTKSNIGSVPEDYIRKQTLTNSERYITPELKEQEGIVLNAETKINKLEYDLFTEVRGFIESYIEEIQETSKNIAQLDVLASYAEVSVQNGYVKPEINTGDRIIIEKGRHPVIEQMMNDGVFVSNDTYVDREDASMLLITGPNMAGKSTYMRQTALIVLMAQTGCFVPAERAEIGIADRIFTRIGASDNLSQGQSTFFVEMSELAYILNSATEKSLIILDEIGRGTSTYDGLSIAWAVVDHLCRKGSSVRTLFATHYHELTVLENRIKGLKNLNVSVAEANGQVVFLHKITEGSASQSYGIEVARLAGVPEQLLAAASDKLADLERNSSEEVIENRQKAVGKEVENAENSGPASVDNKNITDNDAGGAGEQISFFSFAPDPVTERLKNLDLMELTPSEAFSILEELKETADKL